MPVEKIRLGDEPTWELVYKRNKVERLKEEKFPLDIRDELPDLIRLKEEQGLEAISEDDMVRLYWWGVCHDKPKVGTFMVRMKAPCGRISSAELRGVGRISEAYGDNYAELTTRMGIQLHNVRLEHLPEVLTAIEETGLTTAGAEGDTVRNVTGCPVADVDPNAPFDVTPVIDEVHEHFAGNRGYSDLPRKLKFTITGCPHQCSGPEFHGVALLAVVKDGEPGFAVRVGGGLSSTPRISRDLGIFVPVEETVDVLEAIADAWQDDLRYRISRAKARIKFMVDDHGPDGVREMVEARVHHRFERCDAPDPVAGDQAHLGVHPQAQEGLVYAGFSVPQGWVTGEQLQALADVLDEVGADLRFTRLQNFLIANIPREDLDHVADRVGTIGFPLDRLRIFGDSVACTSHQYCNYSVAPTKEKAQEILETLEARFGDAVEGLTLFVDGCPHACAHHWVGNIGLQGTTARSVDGDKVEAYDITLRGGLGTEAGFGTPLIRRLPSDEATEAVVRLAAAWIDRRDEINGSASGNGSGDDGNGSNRETLSFQAFCHEHSDAELRTIALGKDAVEEAPTPNVTLRLSGPLLDFTGGIDHIDIRATRAKTVGKLVQAATRRYRALQSRLLDADGRPTEDVNVYLNEEDVRDLDGLETPVEAGDEVLVLPALSGGCWP